MIRVYAVAWLLEDNTGKIRLEATLTSGSLPAILALLQTRWSEQGDTVLTYDVAEAPAYFLGLIKSDFTVGTAPARRIRIRRVTS